jgi:hypothetical protein
MAASTVPITGWDVQVSWRGHAVGYIKGDISGLGVTVGKIDYTSRSSTNAVKQFKAGLVEIGDLSFEMCMIPGDTTGQKTMYTDCKARTEGQVILTLPDDTTITFNAFVSKFGDIKLPIEGDITVDVSLTPAGDATFSGYA